MYICMCVYIYIYNYTYMRNVIGWLRLGWLNMCESTLT